MIGTTSLSILVLLIEYEFSDTICNCVNLIFICFYVRPCRVRAIIQKFSTNTCDYDAAFAVSPKKRGSSDLTFQASAATNYSAVRKQKHRMPRE
ncbi:hypothetical protein BSQ44_13720 [Aquibium oceanicum]|uniref:Uncharacterized protein n=1 Tax=Aquibium oceanicum TaxID=1670800 RepID=A0A1L3SS99_9HYPH|nr:hypothetical protein BSQ44_13720 [Aquibium oceanicum]